MSIVIRERVEFFQGIRSMQDYAHGRKPDVSPNEEREQGRGESEPTFTHEIGRRRPRRPIPLASDGNARSSGSSTARDTWGGYPTPPPPPSACPRTSRATSARLPCAGISTAARSGSGSASKLAGALRERVEFFQGIRSMQDYAHGRKPDVSPNEEREQGRGESEPTFTHEIGRRRPRRPIPLASDGNARSSGSSTARDTWGGYPTPPPPPSACPRTSRAT